MRHSGITPRYIDHVNPHDNPTSFSAPNPKTADFLLPRIIILWNVFNNYPLDSGQCILFSVS